ncbi:rhamnogalacturonan lyase [Actinoplanes sichuanensis]|nr:rhamnogalacturonan lyase [Actinoplanes sichuanensis]
MENLGRGVVAVRRNNGEVLVSWRLLALDPAAIGFNVYRSTAGGAYTKLNSAVLTKGTNFVDTTADKAKANSYRVRAVTGGTEQAPSTAYTLAAGSFGPAVKIPIKAGAAFKFVWTGDLDGDGEYDYLIDRQANPQSLEAYRGDGTFLWSMSMGKNSANQNNIEGGSSTIDVGNWDGVTVFDFDSDGKAEVAVRIANGVTFGDGSRFSYSDDVHQFIAILDGMSGKKVATAPVPDDYLADGPLYARFGVGYLDGKTPSLVAFMKNRVGNGDFNLVMTAWKFDGSAITRQWKWLREGVHAADGHNTRIIDVDGDGKDEVAEIGFVLNGDGTLRYTLDDQGIGHGDRWYIADIDPSRPGLEGYGIQQLNKSGLLEYYYDAATGKVIWQHKGGIVDVGRGLVGDIDPAKPGLETWSYSGVYNGPTGKLLVNDTKKSPWPAFTLWWDGDLGAELYNDGKIEEWNPKSPADSQHQPRVLTAWKVGGYDAYGRNPALIGDLFGDWREEVVLSSKAHDQLVILTTDQATDTRLYTLAQNPSYRNGMTLKGYLQSHAVDYYLGTGMTTPAAPKIHYVQK